jgi:hypothetical protein
VILRAYEQTLRLWGDPDKMIVYAHYCSFNPLGIFDGSSHTFDTDNIATGDLGGVIATLEYLKKRDKEENRVFVIGDPITPLKEMLALRLNTDWKVHDKILTEDSAKYKSSPDVISAGSI